MKRNIIAIILILVTVVMPVTAKNFLPPGKDISASNLPLAERSARGEVIIDPEVYSYHAFGITDRKVDTDSNSINMRGDIILKQVEGNPKQYRSEPNTVYFSYNIKGIGEYRITLTAADLDLNSDASQPGFTTKVTGKYPEGYTGQDNESSKKKGTYTEMVLRNGADAALGKYGSIELVITADYEGKRKGQVPLAEGYSGVFRIVLEPLERK